MKVSIITVVYNAVSTIDDSINSVINQTHFPEVEYIIIDGGSTDGTLQILNNYKKYFTVLISEKDEGIYHAMNKGISLASGDIVGILNADDLYANNTALERVVNVFRSDQSLDIVYGDLVYVKKTDTDSFVRIWKSCTYYSNFFEDGNVPPHPSVFIKNAIYMEAGQFNLGFKLAADYEFLLRIFKKFSFKSKYHAAILVKMRYGGATNKNFRNIILQNIEILRAWKTNGLNVPILFIFMKIIKRLAQFVRK
ncbi:glycosyltransferase family 2 protein [Daejeonella sp.]|uniref:glycosyltransferase family 2 protein n=1 Tax=Daejeonella sp. TaxID=2805397 RepID=UPI002C058EFB|nr:glycosyltransferase family 2 protein [Daejeonella sp.]HQT24841.1 glycosyltransferase family 2 protein [Daejeonella sp.]HQT58820.1 glycosyltransferase family 2 protein [Daejeonella sp.]